MKTQNLPAEVRQLRDHLTAVALRLDAFARGLVAQLPAGEDP